MKHTCLFSFAISILFWGVLCAQDTTKLPSSDKSQRPGSAPIIPLAASINLPGQEKPRDLVARRIDANDIHSKTLQLTGLPHTGTPTDAILIIGPDGQVINSDIAIGLIAGGTSGNVPNTLVLRDGSGNFAANVITANLFIGNISGNIIGNISGAASENVLRAGDTMTGELRISDPTHPALILNNNTTTPTAVFTGNSTTQAPALQLINNPTATDSNFFLTIDGSGNVTESNVTIGSLTGGTSSNIPNTLVLRDGSGNFAAGTITAGLIGNVTGNVSGTVTGGLIGNVTGNVTGNLVGNVLGDVTGNVVGNVSGAASENVLKVGDTMTGQLRISDPALSALVLSPNTTTPTAVFTGNGTTQAPALQLNNNPTATDSNFFLTIDGSGNVTESNVTIGSLTGGTSSNIPNTLVLRDNQGSFAAQVISAQGLDVVGTSTFHNYIYTPFATVQPQNILYVQKGVLTAPNQFNSVKAAVDSITTGTGPTTPFIVKVGAGTFVEDTITMKPYVGIVGDANVASIIQANNPGQNLIEACDQSFLEHLTLSGATDPGMAAINFDGGSLRLLDINFGSNDILLKERATTQSSSVHLTISNLLDTALTSTGFDVISTTTFRCSMILDDFTWTPSLPINPGMVLMNIRNPNAKFHGENLTVHTGSLPALGSGSRFLEVFNGASIHINVAHIMGFDTALSIPSAPAGPEVSFMGIITENSNTDVLVADQRTTGLLWGEFTREKLNITPDAAGLSILITEPTSGGVTMVGPIFTGRNLDVSTNLSPAFNDGTNLGLISQGLIFTTTSSLVVTVSAGTGYLMQTTAGIDNLKALDWQTTTTTLVPNTDNFIYINNAGQAQVSLSEPPELYTLFMGKVRTSSAGALFVEAIHDEADHTATKLNDTFTEAFGPVYVSGSIVSHTGLNLAATGGKYAFGTHFFEPVGADPLTWQAYLGASANEFLSYQTSVDFQQFDLNGTLNSIPFGFYAKHLLYVIGGIDALSGTSNEAYALVYSQTVFSSLNAAVVGPVPTQPATWSGNIVPIASIVVTNTGTGGIVEILDERPRPGFVPSSVAGVTVHGDLLGLSADDHPQYLLVNGSRAMSGTLQMGTNNITFTSPTSTVDNVIVHAHASRHLPNTGADPLTVGTPVTIGTVNADGTANAFSRSDHVHAHGAQTDPTLHALATTIAAGFMSATDKQALTNATSVNTPSTIVMRDAQGNFAAGTITAGLIGNVTGNVSGTVTGSLIGNVTGNLAGNVLGNLTGNVVGNVSGAASANVLKVGDTMSGQLRISDQTLSALVLSKNTTAPTEVITGNSTTTAPALQLFGNPTAQSSNFFLTIDSSGNVTQSTTTIGSLTGGTSGNVPNTLVLRDGSGNFAATTITANLIGNVTGNVAGNVLGNLTGNVVGNVSGAASANVLKVGDTMSGQLRISDATLSALVLSKNTTAPTEVITGNGTTLAPALRLLSNPTAQSNSFFLMIDPSGNVTQSSINVNPLLNATSGDVFNTLVLRDGSGNFAATTITAGLVGYVTGGVTGNVSGAASANVLKVGDTMSGQLRISDATLSALVLTNNSTNPTAVFTGNSTTLAPALRLLNNPTSTTNDTILTIDSSGNITRSTTTIGTLTGTSGNVANTLVLRDGSGNFAAGAITGTSFVGTGFSTGPTALFTGQSTTAAPALRLAGTPTMAVPSSSLMFDTTGYVLTSDLTGNVMQSVGNNGDTFRTFFSKPNWYQWTEPRLELSFFDDFTNSTAVGTTGVHSDTFWTVNIISGGTIGTPPVLTASNDYGVVLLTIAGGDTTVMHKNPSLLTFGQGTFVAEMRPMFPTLGTAGQQYISRIGFGNSTTATDFTNGIYFEYANGTSGNVWRCRTINGGAATTTVTGVAVTANVYNRLRFEVNAAGTSVAFFIDGTLVATHTTNIPTSVANASTPTVMLTKTNGGGIVSMNFDYFMYHYVFTNLRSN